MARKETEMSLNQNTSNGVRNSVAAGPSLVLGMLVVNLAAAADGSAPAASEEGWLEPVMVTAQRREQDIQDVGVSIAVLGGEQLRDMAISDSRDISRMVPGVLVNSVMSDGPIANNLTIRGVSQSDFSPIQESPNSFYLDDVYLSSPNAAAFKLYDLARVEILRGPQGTLFGRASSGGLVNYIYARPTDSFESYAEIGYGRFNDRWAEAAVSGPISDRVRARLSGRWQDADGYMKNALPGGKAAFATKSRGIRGQIEADLSDDLTARLVISYDDQPLKKTGTYKVVSAYTVGGEPALLPADVDGNGTGPGNDFTGYRDPFPSAYKGSFNNAGFSKSHKFSPTLNLEWNLGETTVSSITNFTKYYSDYNEDTDGGPVDFAQFAIFQELWQWSQELRATGETGGVRWTGGVFYLNTKQDARERFVFPASAGTDFAYDTINSLTQKLSSISAFGQLEYNFTDKFRGTLGARYTRDRKTMDQQNFFAELGSFVAGGGSTVYDPPLRTLNFNTDTVGSLAKHKVGMWSGKVQLDYLPTDNTLLYVSLSRGVKGPGFNFSLGDALPLDAIPFKDEHMYAYEAGAKLTFLDNRLRVNGSAFYYDYHDFQGFGFNGLVSQLGNYRANFKGGEIEITATPDPSLTIFLGAAYLESEVKNVLSAYFGPINSEGVSAPRWTANGLISKSFQLPGGNSINLQWNGNYRSRSFSSVDNNRATRVDGSFVHNARIAFRMEESGLEIAAFVDNISNKERMVNSFDLIVSTGSLLRTYDRPRWWGVSIRKSW
ncbi:MAG: TonB-dependent receptor [Dehalococcoidia bacterium]